MPTYHYQCLSCDTAFDRSHVKIEDRDDQNCDCGGEVKRLLSPPTITFKGSGFYSTDKGR